MNGCTSLAVVSHVPISTMVRLSSLKLAQIDPAQLRVAARLPDRLEPQPHGVKVRIDIKQAGGGAPQEFILEPAVELSELAPLSAYARPGHRLWVYRLSQHDRERLQRLMTDAGGASGVTIEVGAQACHRKPLGPAQLPTATLLQTDSSGFFVVTEDLDLRSVVSEQDLAGRVPPCP
jgi:hypothetical protein